MNRSIRLATLIWICAAYAFVNANQLSGQETSPKIELPDDPNKVVLRLNIRYPRQMGPPKTNPLAKKQGDTKQDDTKQGDTKQGDKKQGDKKQGDKKQGDKKQGDKKQGDKKQGDKKQGDTKQGDKNETKATGGNDKQKVDGQKSGERAESKQDGAAKGKQADQKKLEPPETGGNASVPQDQQGKPVTKPVQVQGSLFVMANQQDEPLVEIYADGRVKCGRIRQGSIAASSKLTEEQLQELMSYVVNEQKFFELNVEDIDRKVSENEKLDRRRHAQFTFTVATKNQEKQIAIKGVRALASLFPEFDPLQRAFRIYQRLNQLFVTINVGGRQNMITILQAVNEKLKKHNELAPEFGIDDATFIAVETDGSMRVIFGKTTLDEKGRMKYRYVATFRKIGDQTKVAIYGYGN